MIVKFDKKFLVEELELPWAALEDKVTDTGRWSIYHEIVFKKDGKFYSTTYSIGATESQDERPWEYEDEVECVEVHKVEKIVEVWEPVV